MSIFSIWLINVRIFITMISCQRVCIVRIIHRINVIFLFTRLCLTLKSIGKSYYIQIWFSKTIISNICKFLGKSLLWYFLYQTFIFYRKNIFKDLILLRGVKTFTVFNEIAFITFKWFYKTHFRLCSFAKSVKVKWTD